MTIIKEYQKDNKKVIQRKIINDLGLEQNSVEIQVTKENGEEVSYPVMPLLRLNDYKSDEPFRGDNVSPYTDEECEEILNNN